MTDFKDLKIAVAGTGYVGMSIATLLSQHHQVTAVDVIAEKVEKINNRISPIQDEYIEKYLAEKELNLRATLDGKEAYRDADFVVIAAPTNYDPVKNYFDTSHVEEVIDLRQKAPNYDEQYGIMQNNINRLTRLLRQILEVRKSQAGQLKLKVRKQNIAEFIEAACDNIRPMAEARGIKLIFNYRDSSKIDVWFDADKMDKILYNLLSNAVKYSHENGQIIVELQFKQKAMIISVADQGIGISKEKLRLKT